MWKMTMWKSLDARRSCLLYNVPRIREEDPNVNLFGPCGSPLMGWFDLEMQFGIPSSIVSTHAALSCCRFSSTRSILFRLKP
ncbi:unnamed protein product [Citrullus colocynthis]|uniref:Uncharacterized protein n=1 Tax=Citrullus colocynthis TaxID=252529 RepID=A0ABP0Z770_9ROSI